MVPKDKKGTFYGRASCFLPPGTTQEAKCAKFKIPTPRSQEPVPMEAEGDGHTSTASSDANSYEALMIRIAMAEKQNREFHTNFSAKQDKVNN